MSNSTQAQDFEINFEPLPVDPQTGINTGVGKYTLKLKLQQNVQFQCFNGQHLNGNEPPFNGQLSLLNEVEIATKLASNATTSIADEVTLFLGYDYANKATKIEDNFNINTWEFEPNETIPEDVYNGGIFNKAAAVAIGKTPKKVIIKTNNQNNMIIYLIALGLILIIAAIIYFLF